MRKTNGRPLGHGAVDGEVIESDAAALTEDAFAHDFGSDGGECDTVAIMTAGNP